MKVPKLDPDTNAQRTNSSILAIVAIATVIVVFCLVSARALLNQGAYQRRVVNEKNNTVEQLEKNIEAAKTLTAQYASFEAANPNIIGGPSQVPDNAEPPAGQNGRIVLDALPNAYDFPALISSLSKVLGIHGFTDTSIGGTDQSADQKAEAEANPQPVTIEQIPITGSANYAQVQGLVKDLERSIRPFDITSLQLSISNNSVQLSLNLNTFYQPSKGVILEKKEVK